MIIFEDSLLNSKPYLTVNISADQFSQGRLTQDALYWQDASQQRRLAVADMIGVTTVEATSRFSAFVISSCSVVLQWFGKRRREVREYYFLCPTSEVRSRWLIAIRRILYGEQFITSPRQFHIFVNPYSGQKHGDRIFKQIQPVLEKSYVTWQLTRTQGSGDTQQFVYQMDLTHLDGLIVVGGDGTVHEVINGLMSRGDWETAIKTPIGIIPAGTGNGLCKTLLEFAEEPYDPISAAFLIARGREHAIDLAVVEQDQRHYYSILSIAWALPSQIDIESEKLRYLGSLRNTIYALFRICFLCSYEGKLSFLPHPFYKNQDWRYIEGSFILFWAMNTAWATYDLKVAPFACLDDGGIDVVVIRKGISRLQLLLAFLKCGNGSHLNLPEVECYKVQQFYLEPTVKNGTLAIDGECYPCSSIRVFMAKSLARFFFISR